MCKWVTPNLFSIPFDINGESTSANFQIKMSDMKYYTDLRILYTVTHLNIYSYRFKLQKTSYGCLAIIYGKWRAFSEPHVIVYLETDAIMTIVNPPTCWYLKILSKKYHMTSAYQILKSALTQDGCSSLLHIIFLIWQIPRTGHNYRAFSLLHQKL
jgi:hypothetical protein